MSEIQIAVGITIDFDFDFDPDSDSDGDGDHCNRIPPLLLRNTGNELPVPPA
jgi:hypothetical protein